MPPGLSSDELSQLDDIICNTRHIARGEMVFRSDDAFENIYAVRVGSFKTVVVNRDGMEVVTGFQIPGEMLGLDGVCDNRHRCDAVALEDSVVCVIPFAQLERVCRELKPMQHYVHQMMSGEIVRESGQLLLLCTMTAPQRVAAFLLNLSARFRARGYSAAEFNLRMTREEIGCFLGLKLETVSRTFSKFHREQLIDPCGKQIRILDAERLARV